MICTVIKSTPSSKNPMFYNLNKVEQGEAEIVAIRNFTDDKFGTIYRTLLERDAIAKRTEKPSVHLVLSLDDGENLTDAQVVELFERILKDVGMENQPYVIVRHDDTKHGHYHVFSTKIKEDGKSIVWNGIGKRLVHSLAQYQEEYNYFASRDLHQKKLIEKQLTGWYQEAHQQLNAASSMSTSIEEIMDRLAADGITLSEFHSKHTGKKMVRLSRPASRPVYVSAENTVRMQDTVKKNLASRQAAAAQLVILRKQLENLAKQSTTFVIHNAANATLFVKSDKRDRDVHQAAIEEAARSILKYKTWSADVCRYEDPKELIKSASKAKAFGSVDFDYQRAQFIEIDGGKVLENPKDVITFRDAAGQVIDLITSGFIHYWRNLVQFARDRRYKENKSAEQLTPKSKETGRRVPKTPKKKSGPHL